MQPPMIASPPCLLRLKRLETGGVGKRVGHVKLLPLGTPALDSYPDIGGVWTCGWGATGPAIGPTTSWTLEECKTRFAKDVATRDVDLGKMLLGCSTTQAQYDALFLLLYNIGKRNLSRSTLLDLHHRHRYTVAAKEFLRWNKANGMVSEALVERRAIEKQIYEGTLKL